MCWGCCGSRDYLRLTELRQKEYRKNLELLSEQREGLRETCEVAGALSSWARGVTMTVTLGLMAAIVAVVATEEGQTAFEQLSTLLGGVYPLMVFCLAVLGIPLVAFGAASSVHSRALGTASSVNEQFEAALMAVVSELPAQQAKSLVEEFSLDPEQRKRVLGPLAVASQLEAQILNLKKNQQFLLTLVERIAENACRLPRAQAEQLLGAGTVIPLLRQLAGDPSCPHVRAIVSGMGGHHVTPGGVTPAAAPTTGKRPGPSVSEAKDTPGSFFGSLFWSPAPTVGDRSVPPSTVRRKLDMEQIEEEQEEDVPDGTSEVVAPEGVGETAKEVASDEGTLRKRVVAQDN
jgi:hypothetical protein